MNRLSLLAFTILIASCNRSLGSNAGMSPPSTTDSKSSPLPLLTECYQADEWTCAVEAAIVKKTNAKRAANLLAQSFESSFVSRHWSDQQQATESLSHDGFPAERKATLESHFPQLNFFYTAENVAMTMTNAESADAVAEEIVEMWWKSSGHRKNMLGPYRYIGAGVARLGRIVYVTQIFH